jgi:hypothetical protein
MPVAESYEALLLNIACGVHGAITVFGRTQWSWKRSSDQASAAQVISYTASLHERFHGSEILVFCVFDFNASHRSPSSFRIAIRNLGVICHC